MAGYTGKHAATISSEHLGYFFPLLSIRKERAFSILFPKAMYWNGGKEALSLTGFLPKIQAADRENSNASIILP